MKEIRKRNDKFFTKKSRNSFVTSALHLAASMASIEPLKLLLSLGFDPDDTNQAKETPLFVAARTNNIDAACVLIENGIDCRIKNVQGKVFLILKLSNLLFNQIFRLYSI